jgi:hypothetical protein
MLPHNAPIGCLEHAVSALEAVDDWEHWLWQRPVEWQWHAAEIILPLPLLKILGELLSRFESDLVFITQVGADRAWT